MEIDIATPQARAAQEFMAYKGYPDVHPFHMELIEGQDCWYFYYLLPEGVLELEVEQEGKTGEWSWTVTYFGQQTPTPA